MENFQYLNTTKLIFGKDSYKNIGELVKPYTNKVLLHYGGGSVKKSGVFDNVVNSLAANHIEYVELGGVQPNPILSLVHKGVELCKKESVGFILAVGGGSVIDSAKAIAMGVNYDGDVWDFFESGEPVSSALPVATILTIPAAGSETSHNTVITNQDTQRKYGYGSPAIRPQFSIIDPSLFVTLSKYQMACGVSDMMSHVFERYFTQTKHTDLTDGLCESTLKTMMKNALLLMDDITNYDAWCEIGFAGSFCHNGYLGLGRQEDWGCHAMEHELSAFFDVPHGAGLAVVTPPWMRYVYSENPDIFVQFACNVMGVTPNRDKEKVIHEGIKRLESFYKQLALPQTFSQLGINNADITMMAQKCTHYDGTNEYETGWFKKLGWKDVYKIYNAVNV